MSVILPPITGPFVGMTQAQLEALRSQAQTALANIITGGMPVTLSYSSGDGQKSVTYSRTSEAALRNLIGELNAALGQGRRRAIGIIFR
jgi:hypothetical protein